MYFIIIKGLQTYWCSLRNFHDVHPLYWKIYVCRPSAASCMPPVCGASCMYMYAACIRSCSSCQSAAAVNQNGGGLLWSTFSSLSCCLTCLLCPIIYVFLLRIVSSLCCFACRLGSAAEWLGVWRFVLYCLTCTLCQAASAFPRLLT